MTARLLLAAVSAAALTVGCSPQNRAETADASAEIVSEAPPAPRKIENARNGGDEAAPSPLVTPRALLAYVHTYRLELPARAVTGLMNGHEQACVRAGPAVCQVVEASVRSAGRDETSGRLTLKAVPAWAAEFRRKLAPDAEKAGGRVADSGTSTEDLTRRLVDTEARLRALTTLQTRLEGLLAARPGKLQELLEVERELARVGGEIDATRSALAVMRSRVATETLTLTYASRGVLAPEGAFAPVGQAASGVVRNAAGVLGAIITLASFLAPIALVLGVPAWLLLRARRRRVSDVGPVA